MQINQDTQCGKHVGKDEFVQNNMHKLLCLVMALEMHPLGIDQLSWSESTCKDKFTRLYHHFQWKTWRIKRSRG